ncbi:hypothetical protein BJ878DRAFT_46110 [Calycina marina]|uniref:Uncharacterized protein n=1 Tax=Calycina marina TaxID=1763456 RepID=A0A9P7ZAM2_9HELO|nr:hypothetical protein BJ878DRAFT_46110 [Calycina marina]
MVLDTANSDTDPFAPPADDSDPYSDPSQPAGTRYSIDASVLPKPIPLLGIGFSAEKLQLLLRQKIQTAQTTLRRPVTQSEADAFAFWSAKQLQIISYGNPCGIGGGLYRAYSTHDTFRFPFYQPSAEKLWDANGKFQLSGGFLRGQRALIVVHIARAVAYGALGQIIGQILFAGYAASVGGVGEIGDKRLKVYMEALRMDRKERKDTLLKGGRPGQSTQAPVGKQQSMLSQSDAGESEEEARELAGTYTDVGVPDTTNMSPTQSSPVRGRRPASYQETPSQPSYDYDEASSSGGLGMNDDTLPSSTSPPQQTGSAWDRIRSGSKSSQNLNKPKSSWPSTQAEATKRESAWAQRQADTRPSTEDSFSYSKVDGERDLAKSEAQKEFDAKVERERRGGSFTGGGDLKRW